ncbi:MAG: Nif3-like dinuclear metal center hexameric protein [Prevotella sp.]|nr:Nif3-like dinuclear metal center hexameric protein [Candidatus Equicola stercoris]
MTKIKTVLDALERFAPLPLQEDWDNAGLQIGLTETEVLGALLCLDVTEEIVDEAMKKGCNLIISHHPLIFHPLKRICDEDFIQRIIRRCIKNDITIVSMHTNLDNAENGVNYKIAEKLSLTNLRFLKPCAEAQGKGGSGVIGELAKPLSAEDFLKRTKDTFNAEVLMTNELLTRNIKTVALCGGAGAFLLEDAIQQGADAFITGEMHYHEYFDTKQKIQIIVMGHYESEHFTQEILEKILHSQCPDVKTYIATTNTNPIRYFV